MSRFILVDFLYFARIKITVMLLCDIAPCGSTFRTNILPPSSGQKWRCGEMECQVSIKVCRTRRCEGNGKCRKCVEKNSESVLFTFIRGAYNDLYVKFRWEKHENLAEFLW